MALRDDIEAIRADESLTANQKLAAIARTRANGVVAAVRKGNFPFTFTRGRFEVEITSAGKWGNDGVEVFLNVKRDGKELNVDPHHVIINPPILFPDEDGDVEITDTQGKVRRYREDPLACILEALIDAVRR